MFADVAFCLKSNDLIGVIELNVCKLSSHYMCYSSSVRLGYLTRSPECMYSTF